MCHAERLLFSRFNYDHYQQQTAAAAWSEVR
jgi:hypothetical protein